MMMTAEECVSSDRSVGLFVMDDALQFGGADHALWPQLVHVWIQRLILVRIRLMLV
jgi:hypothetical protein